MAVADTSLEGKLSADNEKTSMRSYSFDEAYKETLDYFDGDGLAAKTWVSKYALKDSEGNIYETNPDQMHRRISKELARIESKYKNPMSEEKIYDLIKNFEYIVPQGSPMAGIGNDLQLVSLSNCFVIGNEGESDSYGGIMHTDQEQAQLMKRRGGVGHDMSHLRPRGSSVDNSALTSTGIVSFMERYSNTTREVAQDGRRGALMLSISVKHPDAENFIDAKLEPGKITGANVSIKILDEFMKSIKDGRTYTQQYPIHSDNPSMTKEIKPEDLWEKITHNAWKTGEPGVLFWDTILRESVADCYADLGFETVCTNPCGEIPLCIYDSCRLSLQNLYSYVENPFTDKAEFNWSLFKEHAEYAQRIMDDIVDLEIEKIEKILDKINKDPEAEEIKAVERNLWEKIKDKAERGRRTGMGVTGEGDMIAALGLKYGTEEATAFSVEVHKNLALEAYRSSVNLAKERGQFPMYDSSREENNPFIQRIRDADEGLYQDMIKHGRRNISQLTIAPGGSVSIETQTTSGLEQVFLVVHERKRKVNPNDQNVTIAFVDDVGDNWEKYLVFHSGFEKWLEVNGHNVDEVKNLSKDKLDEVIKQSPYYEATSEDVDWLNKVKMQGAVQKWVDHSISTTVNVPKDTPQELISDIYRTAWEVGCKGITVYRAESRDGVLTAIDEGLEGKFSLVQKEIKPHPLLDIKPQSIKYRIKRNENGDSLHIIGTSDLYVDDETKKAYFIPDEDFQVRAPLGEATSVSFAQSGMDRTQILRAPNPDYAEFITRLQSARSNEEEGLGPRKIKSIEHAVGLAFEDYLLRNGVVGFDPNTKLLINLVQKKDLRHVERGGEEYNEIISQVRVGEDKEIEISGNHGKLDSKFECDDCGSLKYTMEAGCHSPICMDCGTVQGGGCG